jgi:hypothetical protein
VSGWGGGGGSRRSRPGRHRRVQTPRDDRAARPEGVGRGRVVAGGGRRLALQLLRKAIDESSAGRHRGKRGGRADAGSSCSSSSCSSSSCSSSSCSSSSCSSGASTDPCRSRRGTRRHRTGRHGPRCRAASATRGVRGGPGSRGSRDGRAGRMGSARSTGDDQRTGCPSAAETATGGKAPANRQGRASARDRPGDRRRPVRHRPREHGYQTSSPVE